MDMFYKAVRTMADYHHDLASGYSFDAKVCTQLNNAGLVKIVFLDEDFGKVLPINMELMKRIANMKRCPELIGVTKTLLCDAEWDGNDCLLTALAQVDNETVKGTFKVPNCSEEQFEKARPYLLAQVLPILYRWRYESKEFGTAELTL